MPTSTAIMLTNCRLLQRKKEKEKEKSLSRRCCETFELRVHLSFFFLPFFFPADAARKRKRCHQLAAARGCSRFVLREVRRGGTLHLFAVVPPRRTKDTRRLTNCFFFFPNATLQNHNIGCEQSGREQGRTSSVNHLNAFSFFFF